MGYYTFIFDLKDSFPAGTCKVSFKTPRDNGSQGCCWGKGLQS